ncbi:sensor histidine kinase [Duganella sp. LX20W]|uniref:C4-dicarboxylate transport sensor protein DctB n=1 Tax=Rugamonas brunnea TaxID=2758569 RepID=A0A7W2ICX8_9BURK|nr:ATP-binding protein [Rugamonas brunnea]MBA5638728.1 sensor histidine kinase [Rugamonas brunnea]
MPQAVTSELAGPPTAGRKRWTGRTVMGWTIVVAVGLVLAGVAYAWAERITTERLRVSGAQRLDVYAGSLENLLGKYDFLPSTLELSDDVIDMLQKPEDAALQLAVNQHLERLNRQAGSTTIYVSDLRGITLAASNWREPNSFVGDNVAFRPYVRDALRGKPAGFYGVGTTFLEPGYFFAHGIYRDGRMLGVATVKVNIEKLEKAWVQGADKVLLSDEHGVIFLTSVPAWKYKTLGPLSADVQRELAATRQYFSHALTPLDIRYEPTRDDGVQFATIRASASGSGADTPRRMLSQSLSLAPRHWQFIYLSDLSPARSNAQTAFLLACLLQAFLIVLYLYVRQRRRSLRLKLKAKEDLQHAYDNLELMVAERTYNLKQMTRSLSDEIAVRQWAEDKLRVTQNELVQAGKMAVLGQMAAGITHELNQPLTALRTMSDNAAVLLDRGRIEDAKSNLGIISQIVGQMGTITGQLKAFSRKSTGNMAPVAIQPAVANALFLVERRLEQEGVGFRLDVRQHDAYALCEGNRLEQVLVNLFNNALDAMSAVDKRQLTVTIEREGSRLLISVDDTGPGIPDEVRAHLFEPFFTTKEQGAGLGLGLAISEQIVVEFGGILRADPAPGGGARFTIDLPISEQGAVHG